jgi:site-specific DNA recombinase
VKRVLPNSPPPQETKRVAIYTRQSVERENGGEFGSIEAQREAVLAYIASQRSLGWVPIDAHYDDRGISGGTADRPGLHRLLDDVRARRVEIVACYKLDRLSRSIGDFSSLLAIFDSFGVAFVSTTQAFNSATSVGRLTLNLLGTFAQFEREQIAERTADKIRASRERGLWTGGRPILGYDSTGGALLVNSVEAAQVRDVFEIYLEQGTLPKTLAELRRRGIKNKAWTTKNGNRSGGRDFDLMALRRLLRSPIVAGKIRAGDRVVAAQHTAIVDSQTFAEVQNRLDERGSLVAAGVRPLNPWGPLLSGLVKCARCGRSMGHTWSSRGSRTYRYYTCASIQKHGAAACPGSRVPAHELEDFVVAKLKGIGTDPDLVHRTLQAAHARMEERGAKIRLEMRRLQESDRRSQRRETELGEVTRAIDSPSRSEARLDALRAEKAVLSQRRADDDALRIALAAFAPIWATLEPNERRRIVLLLVEKVVVDVPGGSLELVLRDRTLQAAIAREGTAS